MGQGYSQAEAHRRPRSVPASPSISPSTSGSGSESESDEGGNTRVTVRTNARRATVPTSFSHSETPVSIPEQQQAQQTRPNNPAPKKDVVGRMEGESWQPRGEQNSALVDVRRLRAEQVLDIEEGLSFWPHGLIADPYRDRISPPGNEIEARMLLAREPDKFHSQLEELRKRNRERKRKETEQRLLQQKLDKGSEEFKLQFNELLEREECREREEVHEQRANEVEKNRVQLLELQERSDLGERLAHQGERFRQSLVELQAEMEEIQMQGAQINEFLRLEDEERDSLKGGGWNQGASGPRSDNCEQRNKQKETQTSRWEDRDREQEIQQRFNELDGHQGANAYSGPNSSELSSSNSFTPSKPTPSTSNGRGSFASISPLASGASARRRYRRSEQRVQEIREQVPNFSDEYQIEIKEPECDTGENSDHPGSLSTENEQHDPLKAVAPAILAELAHLDLSRSIVFKNSRIVGGGTYGDVSTGSCVVSGQRIKIAIKRLRFWLDKDIKMLFEREIYVWSKLSHPNILPLLGYAIDDTTGFPLMISEWMENGSAWEYVTRHPSCKVMGLVVDIAGGLAYLHSLGVVHSDIKSDNIMVSNTENALICDFGCSRMVDPSRTYARLTSSVKGTSRYLAYELVVGPNMDGGFSGGHTTKTDVWAFGMTMFELCTRQRPYANLLDTQVITSISRRELPKFPSRLTPNVETYYLSGIKTLCDNCWRHDPAHRPSMQSVFDELKRICQLDTVDK